MNKKKSLINVSHVVGLSGLGGVQRNFSEYIEYASKIDDINHTIYSIGEAEDEYTLSMQARNIFRLKNFIKLIFDCLSGKNIVHFYNNLTSFKLFVFLFFLPVKKIIIHERGTCWNLPIKFKFIVKFNFSKSDFIIANSVATKKMLEQKFDLDESKIHVIHNGISSKLINFRKFNRVHKNFDSIGFLGRLDSPKGLIDLLDSMKFLKNKRIRLFIAGDGPQKKYLKKILKSNKKIYYLGRVSDLKSFFRKIDLLVVPSIREPFGNVIIESAAHKVPVLASNVDGIPEIITKNSGYLIQPKDRNLRKIDQNELTLPEFIYDPRSMKIVPPRRNSSYRLAIKIFNVLKDQASMKKVANIAYLRTLKYFNFHLHNRKLRNIYSSLM